VTALKQLALKDMLKILDGKIINGNNEGIVNRVAINPSKLKENTLYFHFPETKAVTADFKFEYIIVTSTPSKLPSFAQNVTIVLVRNIAESFNKFIDFYRDLFYIPVIGITGTVGKTTVTEMLKSILSDHYKIQATKLGLNGLEMNLPYLLGINETTELGIFEMGVTHPGNIRKSCKYFKPQIGLILNIGAYHLLGCKTLENYIKAKGEIIEGLDKNGTLIINQDDSNINKLPYREYPGSIVSFGINQDAAFRAENIRWLDNGMKFTVKHVSDCYNVFVPSLGMHNIYNSLAVIATIHSLGLSPQIAVDKIASFKQPPHHMKTLSGKNGCTIIDDSWNNNPVSMNNALTVLSHMNKLKKIAVLGNMPQLGNLAIKECHKVASRISDLNLYSLILIGEQASEIGKKAIDLGFHKGRVFFCQSGSELYETLLPMLDKNTLVLFKFPYHYRLRLEKDFCTFMTRILSDN
jgi:UDP-N-acetylmuramoyl-tripeptide--D-alanyl-D-alanine ligase